MTRRMLTAVTIAIVLIALAPAVALAQPGFGGRDRGPGPGFGPGLRYLLPPPGYLDLSDEQTEATREILAEVRDELGAQRDERRALREELRAALEADEPDAGAVGEIVIELHGQRGGYRAVLESADARFEAILDEGQLVKWENFKELRQLRRRDRGPRGPRGFGFGRHGFAGPGAEFEIDE